MFRVQSHGSGPFPVVVACPVIGWDPGLWFPAPTRGHVVYSPVAPRVAPQQAPGPEDQSLDGAVNADCLQRVGGAAGRVAAPGTEGRGDVSLVGDDGRGGECDKHSPHDCDRAFHLRHARSITRSRWVPSSLEGTPRALEDALTTSLVPSGRSATRSRMRWRSCRLTRLRPLARLISRLGTTKPTRRLLRSSSARTWTTTSGSPARAPCRIAAVKSAGSTMRCARGSTGVSQADSLARPLRRRAARMARPARVDMRRRKPCVFERRRLLGWKVRLVVTAILLGGEWSPTLVDRLGYRPDQGTIAGTHARNGRKQFPRLSGCGRGVNGAKLHTASHTVSTAVEIAVEQPLPQRWMTTVIHKLCVNLLSAPLCAPKVVTTYM